MGKPISRDASFVVSAVKGQTFTGYKTGSWLTNGEKETINGIISENGNVYMADDDGYTFGTLEQNGDLRLAFLEASPDDSAALDGLFTKKR